MILVSLINHPERLNRDTLYELRSVVARYPFFQTARLLLLNNLYLLHEPDFGTELRRSVLYVSDRKALCRLIEGAMDKVEPDDMLEPESIGLDRTLSLIDAFLDTLPNEEDALHLRIESAGDYVTRFLGEDGGEANSAVEAVSDGGMELIDRFIGHQGIVECLSEKKQTSNSQESVEDESQTKIEQLNKTVDVDEETLDESYFTETLAKIYIKQRKYARALEIIRSLYLKYPEKNVYFADQIRFLEKLIINNNSK